MGWQDRLLQAKLNMNMGAMTPMMSPEQMDMAAEHLQGRQAMDLQRQNALLQAMTQRQGMQAQMANEDKDRQFDAAMMNRVMANMPGMIGGAQQNPLLARLGY